MTRISRWRLAAVAAAAVLGLAGCGRPATTAAAGHPNDPTPTSSAWVTPVLAQQLVLARAATSKYVNDLDAAKADGYEIITPMMAGMGYHFLNKQIKGFDVTKPDILVYEKNKDATFTLAALEWVFPSTPDSPPLAGATYGSFPAACHYADGSFVPADAQASCASRNPAGSAFNFWHPDLVTLHVWLWYDNPDGLYHGTNPLIQDS
jgi:hypothetical protein